MTIVEFLLARIDEDEEAARRASPGPWHYGDVESIAGGMLYDKTRTIATLIYEQPEDHDGSIVRHLLSPEADRNGEHVARHDPRRVLAECKAKRAMIDVAFYYGAVIDGEWGCCHDEDHIRAGLANPSLLKSRCEGPREVKRILAPLAAVYADHPDYEKEDES